MKKILLSILLVLSGVTFSQGLQWRLDSLLQGHIDKGEIHGCLVYIWKDGDTVLFKPYGFSNLELKKPMKKDAIFRLASMTKLLTALTALKLYEDGKFLLDEPVKKYIPEFANLRVLSPDCKSIDSIVTIPLERDVTIRDLFRHTAGFSYGGDDVTGQLYTRNSIFSPTISLKKSVLTLTTIPLKYQPGSRWEYSWANDVLGYFIEVVSGKPLDVTMEELLIKPMGLTSTGFMVRPENLERLCNFYEYNNNRLILKDDAGNTTLTQRPALLAGGAGGLASVEDYAKVCSMLLNYGEYNGKRVLNRSTVELLFTNQISNILNRGFPVEGFSMGVGVVPGINNGISSGIFWAGSPYNNTFVIDINRKIVSIMLIQNAPWEHLGLMDKYQGIVREEL